MRVRFAPSPTGQLHVGNARTALFNWLLARGARRHVHPPHRGHRRRAIDARVGGGDPARSALARPRLGRGARHRRRARALPPVRAAAPLSVVREGAARRRARRTTASARRRSSRPSARTRSRPAGRRATPARAAGCRASRRAARIAAGERPAIRFRVPEERDVVFADAVRGDVRFQTDVIGDPVIVRADGTPGLQLRRRRRRCADGGDACDPRRGSHLEHAAADPAVRGARLHAAGVRAPGAGDGTGPQPAVEAARRDVGRRVPREGLPARGAGELPRADRLVARAAATELLPIDELARRFSLERVGHSAGVFDEEKLAWANRHYLKIADPARLAELSLPYFNEAGVRDDARRARPASFWRRRWRWRARRSIGSNQVPARLAFLFDYDADAALGDRAAARGDARPTARARSSRALAEELASAPRLDRERFRAVANQVKARTGQKGKALFHPIRVALTGRAEGPELDLAVPAIDRGAELPASSRCPAGSRQPRARRRLRAALGLTLARSDTEQGGGAVR